MAINKTTTLSIGLDKDKNDNITGPVPMMRAWTYKGVDWFNLTVGRNKEDIHITFAEWTRFKAAIDELINEAKL